MTPLDNLPGATLRDALLAALADDGRWPVAAAHLAAGLSASGLVLVARGAGAAPLEVVAASGLDAEVVRAVLRGAGAEARRLPPIGPGLRSLHDTPPWGGLRDRLGAVRDGACAVPAGGRPAALLWLLRDAAQPPFDDADRGRVDDLLPALAHAVEIRARLRRAEGDASLVRTAFDRVTAGVLLVRDDGTIAFANLAARRILERGDGLHLAGGRLRAAPGDAADRLAAALETAEPSARPVAVAVPRRSGAPDLELLVARLRPSPDDPTEVAGSVVFVVDPEGGTGGIEDHLHALYGLTPAEARLTVQLLAGESLSGAARQLGVSRNTAHTQLASVFAKTGTSSQNELIRRLLRGPAGLHREPTGRHRPVPDPSG